MSLRCEKPSSPGLPDGLIDSAFAEYAAVPAKLLVKLPKSVSHVEGANVQTFASALINVLSANPQPGDTVVVIGQGCMGSGCMQALRNLGVGTIITIDIREETVELSRKLGADIAINSKEIDPVKAVHELTNGIGADLVVDAAGGDPNVGLAAQKTLEQALKMVARCGTVLEVSYFEFPVSISPPVLRSSSIRLLFGQHGGPHPYAMHELAVKLVASRKVDLKSIVTHELKSLERVPKAMEIMAYKAKYKAVQSQVEL
jgi:threonine dehydrogenase-like Zn-dependent dehydrogenase